MKFSLLRKPEHNISGRQSRMAAEIAGRILRLQRLIATICNRRTAHLSRMQWHCLIVFYSLAFSAYCLWLLLRPFLTL